MQMKTGSTHHQHSPHRRLAQWIREGLRRSSVKRAIFDPAVNGGFCWPRAFWHKNMPVDALRTFPYCQSSHRTFLSPDKHGKSVEIRLLPARPHRCCRFRGSRARARLFHSMETLCLCACSMTATDPLLGRVRVHGISLSRSRRISRPALSPTLRTRRNRCRLAIYEYALVDRTGAIDLAPASLVCGWFLRYELQDHGPGVAEVASIGGVWSNNITVVLVILTRMGSLRGIDQDSRDQGHPETAKYGSRAGFDSWKLARNANICVRANGYLENLEGFRAIR